MQPEPARGGEIFLVATATAVLVGLPSGLVVWFFVQILEDYGYAIFLALPMVIGFTAAVILSHDGPQGLGESIMAAILSCLFAGLGILFFGLEGVVCLFMAAPLWAPLAAAGAVCGWAIQQRRWRRREARGFPIVPFLLMLALLPGSFGFERVVMPEAPLRMLVTEVEVNAPAEAVWEHVVAQGDLPPPTEWLFHLGFAYPLRTRMEGSGVGARRFCDLSTGSMPEIVRVWEPGKRLAFDALQTPPSMKETSIYGEIHPHHLEGFFEVKRGEFELVALPGGRTRIIGRSWLRNRITPAFYWDLWVDAIIHAVHRRVFEQVKELAEKDAGRKTEVGWGV